MLLIKIFVALVWSIIGLVIWIPIIIRISMFYIFAICIKSILGKDFNPDNYVIILKSSFAIYPNGLKNIFSNSKDRTDYMKPKKIITDSDYQTVIKVSWFFIFWGTFGLLFLKF